MFLDIFENFFNLMIDKFIVYLFEMFNNEFILDV